MDLSLKDIEQKAPFIAAFGRTREELSDFKVVIEGENILPMHSLRVALHCCFAAYYIYNISYPPDFGTVMLFLEQYVYKLKPSQKVPLSVCLLIDSLEKI